MSLQIMIEVMVSYFTRSDNAEQTMIDELQLDTETPSALKPFPGLAGCDAMQDKACKIRLPHHAEK